MRILGAFVILAGFIALGAPGLAADPFPPSGAAKLAAYSVCRSAAIVDMGAVGVEFVGRVHRHCEDHRRVEAPG